MVKNPENKTSSYFNIEKFHSMAVQKNGESTCPLAEIRDLSQLCLFAQPPFHPYYTLKWLHASSSMVNQYIHPSYCYCQWLSTLRMSVLGGEELGICQKSLNAQHEEFSNQQFGLQVVQFFPSRIWRLLKFHHSFSS